MVDCPICGKSVKEININNHIDSGCESYVETQSPPPALSSPLSGASQKSATVSSFFRLPAAKKESSTTVTPQVTAKRPLVVAPPANANGADSATDASVSSATPSKRQKISQQAAPLADRMRPRTLDEVCGQDLVGPSGMLRGLIEQGRVPSMILWGGSGTGKTTIARLVANTVGNRFIEINSTSAGVADCKKIFAEAKGELSLSGRKTIIFCDEIHRFSKTQQDVFLGPVESGQVVLIGATTENPSFKIQNALLSRCRTFTLQKLTKEDIISILERALASEHVNNPPPLVDIELISYLATFADGDARTALNLLELALGLAARSSTTKDDIKKSLTKTLVYDRAGDQHYDTISGNFTL
jgi:putative ATPase